MNTIKRKKHSYPLIIFCLILLINPNINVLDLLPDCLAWFILASLIRTPADIAPYFAEARCTFLKLGWLNLVKLPALMMLMSASNTYGAGDSRALVALVFAAMELILMINATRYIFDALFYLGERTDAASFITPFSIFPNGAKRHQPEMLRSFSYLFFTLKALLSALPEFLLLSSEQNSSAQINRTLHYSTSLVASLVLILIIGVLWFVRMNAYLRTIRRENRFEDALNQFLRNDTESEYEKKQIWRALSSAFFILPFATVFQLYIPMQDFSGSDILPDFFLGILCFFAAVQFQKSLSGRRAVILFSLLFTALSLLSYTAFLAFFDRYTLREIAILDEARLFYGVCGAIAIAECIVFILMLIAIYRMLNGFIPHNTGLSPLDRLYHKVDRDYHASLRKKNLVLLIFGAIASLTKTAYVILRGDVKLIETSQSTFVTSSQSEMLIMAVGITSCLYLLYAFYYFSTLKDETKECLFRN